MLTYYTIDINKDRKVINGWADATKKLTKSDDMLREFEVAMKFAENYAIAHPLDGVRVLKHVETVEAKW